MSVFTVTSAGSVVPELGILHLSLHDLCMYISNHRCLRKATILSTQCYYHNAGVVIHRFLLLELHRENRKNIWVRLDRRRGEGVSLFSFMLTSGVTKANDTVSHHLPGAAVALYSAENDSMNVAHQAEISAHKEALSRGAQLENHQVFETCPVLDNLRVLLRAIFIELPEYRLLPVSFSRLLRYTIGRLKSTRQENCWFFCTLIQEHLVAHENATFITGNLVFQAAAPDARQRVGRRYLTLREVPISSAVCGTQRKHICTCSQQTAVH